MTQPASSSSAAALPAVVDVLAAELVLLYTQAEQQLLVNLAHLVDTQPQVLLLAAMRREAIRVATQLKLRSWPLAQRIAALAAQRGDQAALAELRRLVETSPRVAALTEAASSQARAIGVDLGTRLNATLPRIIRFADDAHRAASIDHALDAIRSGSTTAHIAQRSAWRQLTERGITGFTDRAGRRWNLASYVEMATRTAVQRSFNAAHLERMVAAGIVEFTVPSDGHPCPLCKPWQGVTLTVDGPSPTIDEARAAGLWHPNCRHMLIPKAKGTPNVTAPTSWTAADQRWYDATQHLRSLELAVRTQKRVALAALTPLDRKRAERKVRVIQGRIRTHVGRHGLNRRSRREQLDLGNS